MIWRRLEAFMAGLTIATVLSIAIEWQLIWLVVCVFAAAVLYALRLGEKEKRE